MNFIDAYMIVESYNESIGKNQKEYKWIRKSILLYPQKDILPAYKLFFAHALFWNVYSKEELKEYKHSIRYIEYFVDDDLLDAYYEVGRKLHSLHFFDTLFRQKMIKDLSQQEYKLLLQIASQVKDGDFNELMFGGYLDQILPMIKATKEKCQSTKNMTIIADILGNFVCDVYEIAQIERHFEDTEYFWPFRRLYELSNDPKFDYLFTKYRDFIKKHI